MTNLPRRRIEPLDPPPDSFDRVLASARRRRRRTALVAASSTLVIVLVAAGSFAVGRSLNVTQRLDNASHGKGFIAPTSGPTVQSSPTRSHKHSESTPSSALGTQPVHPETISWLRGRAVDPQGHGIGGLFVLAGSPDHLTFSSDGRVAAHTDENGYYKIACPRAPVMLSTWQIDNNLDAMSTGGIWAATFVGGVKGSNDPVVPACGQTRVTTTLNRGASLHGTVHVQGDCTPGAPVPVWVWLNGDRTETVRLVGLTDGDTFNFFGLPAGTHTLGARGVKVSITFVAGSTVEHDAMFTCGAETTPVPTDGSTSPTSTPTPSDTSSPPVTPSPTPSPTIS